MLPFVPVTVNTAFDPEFIGQLLLTIFAIGADKITILLVTLVADCPALGVKVDTTVPAHEVRIIEGLQVPVIPFVEVVGNVT